MWAILLTNITAVYTFTLHVNATIMYKLSMMAECRMWRAAAGGSPQAASQGGSPTEAGHQLAPRACHHVLSCCPWRPNTVLS